MAAVCSALMVERDVALAVRRLDEQWRSSSIGGAV